jgi:signal transduction histidine kinase
MIEEVRDSETFYQEATSDWIIAMDIKWSSIIILCSVIISVYMIVIVILKINRNVTFPIKDFVRKVKNF